MFVDCFDNCGKKYLRILENIYTKVDGKVKIKKKTIKNLGPLDKFDDGKPDFLKRYREQFRNGELKIEGLEASKIKSDEKIILSFSKEDFISNPKNIGYFLLDSLYEKLGIYDVLNRTKNDDKIKYDLNGLTKLFVFGRILKPASKKATFKDKNRYLFPVTSSENVKEIYKVLDVLDKKSESIQTRINTKIKQSSVERKSDLTYYDVTNYYFETMYGDDDIYEFDDEGNKILDEKGKPIIIEKGFRKNGISKEGKKQPLVQMGLFIDNNGIPVSYKLFPGNTQDKTTFKDIIKTSLDNKDLGRVVVVVDNGMNTQENMYLLVNKGNGYIISKSIKKSWNTKAIQSDMQIVKDWALDENNYDCIYNQNKELMFKSKSRIYERTLKDKEGNSITIKEKEIIYWSKKHYEKELHQNQKFIEYLESCKENPNKLKDKQRKSQEYIKVIQTDKKTGEVLKTRAVVVLLEDKIQKYKEMMGYYSIVTSEINVADKEVINKYHGLSRIEDSFRIIKSDLEGRPIYVWSKEHINAHFLICFISLTMIRIIQHKILKNEGKNTLNVDGWKQGITAECIKESLNNFSADKLPDEYCKITNITDELKSIFNSFDINFNFEKFKNSEIRDLRKIINHMSI